MYIRLIIAQNLDFTLFQKFAIILICKKGGIMKKAVILLSVIMLSAGIVYASKYPKYDAELSKIRTIKNAQTSEINKQISEIAINIQNLETKTGICVKEKETKLKEYNAKIDELSAKKFQIEQKYKADKQRLKTLYKH